MNIQIKLHNLLLRFELCVSKFDPAVHKFKFGKGYIRDEIEWIIEQLHLDNCPMEQINTKLDTLVSLINITERALNITPLPTNDIVIDDKEHNLTKTRLFSVNLPNGDVIYYDNGPITIDGINWSVPNYANKFETVVIDDTNNIPNLTYGLKAIDDVADVTIKTFFNGQPINHKDIVPPKISKPDNDIVIE